MKWHNGRDKEPSDKQEVLLSADGINYVGRYDALSKTFRFEDELRETQFHISDPVVYWTEYVNPPRSSHSGPKVMVANVVPISIANIKKSIKRQFRQPLDCPAKYLIIFTDFSLFLSQTGLLEICQNSSLLARK